MSWKIHKRPDRLDHFFQRRFVVAQGRYWSIIVMFHKYFSFFSLNIFFTKKIICDLFRLSNANAHFSLLKMYLPSVFQHILKFINWWYFQVRCRETDYFATQVTTHTQTHTHTKQVFFFLHKITKLGRIFPLKKN